MSIGLLGAGAQAREAASFVPPGDVLFWAADASSAVDGRFRVVDLGQPEPDDIAAAVVAAVGAPAVRQRLVARWPGEKFGVVQSPAAYVGSDCEVGPGSIIGPHAVLTTGVRLGPHTLVNVGASLSHDVVCGEFVTIGPGAVIAGHVSLGDGVFVGAGATVSNRVSIASGTVIGAGAVVLNDVTVPNSVVVGSPAACIRVNEGWLDEI